MRVRKPLRHTAVVLAWLGLFAALLLTLQKLPGTLLGAAPTAVSSRCDGAFHNSGITLECIASTLAAFLPGFRLTEFLPGCSTTRAEVTFDYGGQCSLLLNSGGWVQVPYVRYQF